jgi:hypothetical protein
MKKHQKKDDIYLTGQKLVKNSGDEERVARAVPINYPD